MSLLLVLLACADKGHDSGTEEAEAPHLEWLSPADGDTVAAGDVAGSIVVERFTLEDPAKHSEGGAGGYLSIAVDGAEMLQSGSTTFTIPLQAGAVALSATLFYADGDEILATADALCGEDEEDAACQPVTATVNVTVE